MIEIEIRKPYGEGIEKATGIDMKIGTREHDNGTYVRVNMTVGEGIDLFTKLGALLQEYKNALATPLDVNRFAGQLKEMLPS